MYKVGVIGPESTGKSTLSSYLASRYNGLLVPEYAREYMERRALARTYTREDVLRIAEYQVEYMHRLFAEDKHGSRYEYVFFDTELIITKIWLLHKYGNCPDWIEQAIHQYPMDVYLLCYPDLPWEPDPVRENPTIREYLFDWYEHEIQALNIPYYIVRHVE